MRVSGCVVLSNATLAAEIPGPRTREESAPLIGREHERRTIGIFGVAHGDHAAREAGDFDAVATVAAAPGALAPDGAAQVHRFSATFMIRFREAPRGSASALSASKVSLIFA